MFVDVFEREAPGKIGQRTQRRGETHKSRVWGQAPQKQSLRWAFPGQATREGGLSGLREAHRGLAVLPDPVGGSGVGDAPDVVLLREKGAELSPSATVGQGLRALPGLGAGFRRPLQARWLPPAKDSPLEKGVDVNH